MMNPFQDTLKALGKQARQEQEQRLAAEKQQQKREAEQPDFAALMSDVVPLKDSRRYQAPPDKSPIRPRPSELQPSEDLQRFYVGDGLWLDIPATFSKNGQGSNDIKRLQAGHWNVVADVDLHGYTQEAAQEVLNEFIEFIKPRGVCGEIIHGSGLGSSGYQPVLKNLVRRWLMQHPDVLAYAEPHKNNDGCVRILIKRQRKADPWAEEK